MYKIKGKTEGTIRGKKNLWKDLGKDREKDWGKGWGKDWRKPGAEVYSVVRGSLAFLLFPGLIAALAEG